MLQKAKILCRCGHIIYTILSQLLEDWILTLGFCLKSILYSFFKVSPGFLCSQNFTIDQVMESQVTGTNLASWCLCCKNNMSLTSEFLHPHVFAELLKIHKPLQNNDCCILVGFIAFPLLYMFIINRMPRSTSFWRITSPVSFWVWKLLCRCSIKTFQ